MYLNIQIFIFAVLVAASMASRLYDRPVYPRSYPAYKPSYPKSYDDYASLHISYRFQMLRNLIVKFINLF